MGAEKAEGGKWSLGTPPRDVSIVGTGLGKSSKRGERRPFGTPCPWKVLGLALGLNLKER